MQTLGPMPDRAKVLLQQVILPVFAAPLDGRLVHLGSSFVICGLGRSALLLSAAHVLRHALAVDGTRPLHHPSTPQEFLRVRRTPTRLTSTRLLVYCRETLDRGHFAEILDVYINDPSDIAVCSAYFPESVPASARFSLRLSIDTRPPTRGTPVISAGYGDTKLAVERDDASGISTGRFESKLDYRHGTIVDVFSAGDSARRYGPSFQIDVPISSGMSGGPVINKTYGDHIVACGVNTSDLSSEEIAEGSGSGLRAIAQMLWTCMGIAVKQAEVEGETRPVRLLELAKRGFVDDLGNAVDHIIGVPPPDVEQFSMAWRDHPEAAAPPRYLTSE